MPFFDEGTNLLFLGGKGDGNVRYYEIVNDAPWQFLIESSKGTPARGLCMLPKRTCDVMKCEVVRMLKLTSNSVEPLSFICPRKSDLFQDDLFPDCYAGKKALSADDFFGGKSAEPVLMSMDPAKRPADAGEAPKAIAIQKQKSTKDYEEEIDKLNAYIDKLTKALENAKVKVPEP
jgi:coronin-1B/1C/6